jgi:DNA repair exonuclease SbcCD ATPase subunit
VRTQGPESYAGRVHEIGNVEAKRPALLQRQTELNAALTDALANDDSVEEREVRDALARVGEQLRALDQKLAAKRAQLPGQSLREEAQRRAESLANQTAESAKSIGEAQKAFVAALEAAEHAAANLNTLRGPRRAIFAELSELRATYGLKVEGTAAAMLPTPKLLHLMALYLGETTQGEPSTTIVKDLAATRAVARAR